jgi:hypothetical protein
MSICVVRDIPFAVNMVLTRANLQEIEALVDLAGSLGARGVRFGHLIPTPRSVDEGLYLTHAERNDADQRVHELAAMSTLPVALAPGSRTTELFPCEPLNDNEVNVDWRGRLTRCCHLSGQTHAREGEEVIGSLLETGLPELMARLREANEAFRREKRVRLEDGRLKDEDFFPCDYCLKRFDKVAGFDEKPIWLTGTGEPRHRIATGAARHRAGGT